MARRWTGWRKSAMRNIEGEVQGLEKWLHPDRIGRTYNPPVNPDLSGLYH